MYRTSLVMLLAALLVFLPAVQGYALSSIDEPVTHHDQQQGSHDCCDEMPAKTDCCSNDFCNGDCGMVGCAGNGAIPVILARLADCSSSATGCRLFIINGAATTRVPPQDLRPPIKHL